MCFLSYFWGEFILHFQLNSLSDVSIEENKLNSLESNHEWLASWWVGNPAQNCLLDRSGIKKNDWFPRLILNDIRNYQSHSFVLLRLTTSLEGNQIIRLMMTSFAFCLKYAPVIEKAPCIILFSSPFEEMQCLVTEDKLGTFVIPDIPSAFSLAAILFNFLSFRLSHDNCSSNAHKTSPKHTEHDYTE